MKLIEVCEYHLVVRDRPSLFKSVFILIWASLFIGIPGALLFATVADVGATRLVCQRMEPEQLSCEVTKTKFIGLVEASKQRYPMVHQAQLSWHESVDHEGNGLEDYWVSLETPQGLITLFEDSVRYNGVRGSEVEMLALTDEINTLVQSKTVGFSVERDLRKSLTQLLFPAAFAGLFIVIGIGVIALTFQARTASFDRDRLHWKRYSLLGIKELTIPFDEITKIGIDTDYDSDGVSSYRIYLESQEHDRVQLGTTHWQKQARRIQSTLLDFLQLE